MQIHVLYSVAFNVPSSPHLLFYFILFLYFSSFKIHLFAILLQNWLLSVSLRCHPRGFKSREPASGSYVLSGSW